MEMPPFEFLKKVYHKTVQMQTSGKEISSPKGRKKDSSAGRVLLRVDK